MYPPLLSLADFKDLLEIPEGLEFRRLKVHVLESQAGWLEDVLQPWPTLYPALAAAVLAVTPEAPLQAPLAGLWAVAKPMLTYAAYASFLPFSKTTLTAHSLVEKLSDQSSPTPDPSVSKQVTTVTGWAQRYQVKLLQLLQAGTGLEAYQVRPSCSAPLSTSSGTVTWLPIRNPRR